jgi:hypothetical protein
MLCDATGCVSLTCAQQAGPEWWASSLAAVCFHGVARRFHGADLASLPACSRAGSCGRQACERFRWAAGPPLEASKRP